MKKALVILHNKLKCARIDAHFTANVHDEWQMEVEEQHGEEVGRLAVESIKEAGEHFNLRCPLSGEFSVGRNWKETH
jgi:DNA polymerase I-like protein with 3'-5' exonuclease and polymerase domains